jgi:hypothetical protein
MKVFYKVSSLSKKMKLVEILPQKKSLRSTKPLKRSFHSRFKMAHACQKGPIYTQTRQINYYYNTICHWWYRYGHKHRTVTFASKLSSITLLLDHHQANTISFYSDSIHLFILFTPLDILIKH